MPRNVSVGNTSKLHFLSNPAVVKINDFQVGIVNTDVLRHLSANELSQGRDPQGILWLLWLLGLSGLLGLLGLSFSLITLIIYTIVLYHLNYPPLVYISNPASPDNPDSPDTHHENPLYVFLREEPNDCTV